MHFSGKVQCWFQRLMMGRQKRTCQELTEEVVRRFSIQSLIGVVDELKELKQRGGTVEESRM